MKLRKMCKALLFPPVAILLVLVPLATVFLVYSMVFLGSTSVVACISYVLAAYTLTVCSLRIPSFVSFVRRFKGNNRYARAFFEDAHLRTKLSLHSALLFNTAYAVFHLGLGFYHASFWFHSLSAYYLLLAVVRFFLLRRTDEHRLTQEQQIRAFRVTGWFLLFMNLALSLMIFFMVYWGRSFHHHEITTIAMAAYTFTSLSFAIRGILKYRHMGSPVLLAARTIGLASALVSLLTLESTMLSTFGADTLSMTERRLFLGISGGAISVFIIILAIGMISVSHKNSCLSKEHHNEKPRA